MGRGHDLVEVNLVNLSPRSDLANTPLFARGGSAPADAGLDLSGECNWLVEWKNQNVVSIESA